MPVPVSQIQLAASKGRDRKRQVARRAVALAFFEEHIYGQDAEPDWSIVRKAMQCIDVARPVVRGPSPPASARLVGLGNGALGPGFLAEIALATSTGGWIIAPEAPYLKFYAPVTANTPAGDKATIRYFVPAVRRAAGGVDTPLARRDLS